jgi:hypothetical protein
MPWAAGNKGKVRGGEPAEGVPLPGAPAWDSIAKMIECTVCFDAINGPIYQCSEGHLLCSLCWGRLNRPDAGCPTCSGVLGNIRCRFAESVRDACLGASEAASPSGKGGEGSRKLPTVPRHNAVKRAAEAMGVGMEDLRGVMARDGVGLMEAVIIAARTRVKGEIEESGGIDGYEKRKRDSGRAAVVFDAAHKPAHSPRNPPAHRHAAVKHAGADSAGQVGARGPPLSQRPPREEPSEKQGPKATARKTGADAVSSPRNKVAETEPETVEEKYARYREEIRRQADAIFNEPDTPPQTKVKGPETKETKAKDPEAPAMAGGASAARALKGSSSASANIHAKAGLKLAYGSSPAAKTSARHADKAASHSTDPSPLSPSNPAASPKAVVRPVLNADVMAAYSSFRKDIRSKVLASARSSHDATQSTSTVPPEPTVQGAHGPVPGAPSQSTPAHPGGQPPGEEPDQAGDEEPDQKVVVGCVREEAAQPSAAQPPEVQPTEGMSSPAMRVHDTQCDKGALSACSPASEDGSKARSEAATRSNSADCLSSSSCFAGGSGAKQNDGVGTSASSNTTEAQRWLGGGEEDCSKDRKDTPGLSLGNARAGDKAKGAQDDTAALSSLDRLRFPKIRTDIAVQQAQQHLECNMEECAAGPAARIHAAGTQSAREAREVERTRSETERPRVLLAAPPATSREGGAGEKRPPSTARSLRGSRPGSSTPRDAVRAVKAGDTSGSAVWRIVAGVRNRLRVGPGR